MREKVIEFRITMPMTLDEYEVGFPFTLIQAYKKETGGGEGVTIVKNEPFDNFPLFGGKYTKGQYTYKIFNIESKLPAFVRLVAPENSTIGHEEAWNAYPYNKTIYSNPGYMKGDFYMVVESFHVEEDRGKAENIFELSGEDLKRDVVHIDIADPVDDKDYIKEHDPTIFKSKETGRGPLSQDWIKTAKPVMTAYKLVRVHTNGALFQMIAPKVEEYIKKVQKRFFMNFYREMFCSIDEWYNVTMEEIRAMENEVKNILDEQRDKGEVKSYGGLKAEADAAK